MNHDIFVIGASAGGVEALTRLVGTLPSDFPGSLFVVLHIPAESPSVLPRILTRAGVLKSSHPLDKERIHPGHIYVAPPDYHLLVEQGYVRVVSGPTENRHRPAIDPLFRSAARSYGARTVGIVLSGMLDDGTAGLLAVKRCGGVAVVQQPAEALYPSMPQSALAHVDVDYCLPVREMGTLLVALASEPVSEIETGAVADDLKQEVGMAEMEPDVFDETKHIGEPSVFSCPECGGVLWEIKDGDLVRYRCRVGHALSAESVLAEQTEVIEKALWSALKTLEEKKSLSRRLALQAQERGNTHLARLFSEQTTEAEEHTRRLRELLTKRWDEESRAEASRLDQGIE